MTASWLLLLATTCGVTVAQDSSIAHLLSRTPFSVAGIVVDSTGTPIEGVRIAHSFLWNLATLRPVTTGKNGQFRLDTFAPAVVFRKEGWVAQRVAITGGKADLRVVLDPAAQPVAMEACVGKSRRYSVFGGIFYLPATKRIRAGHEDSSIDTFGREFTVKTRLGRGRLTHGAGTAWGGPEPRDREVWSSVEYDERVIQAGMVRLLDARGRTADGKLWRHIGGAGESAFYFDTNAEAAVIFDQMLDGMCLAQ